MKETQIVLSTKALFVLLLSLAGIWILWMIQSVVIVIFLALIFALALEPAVIWLRKYKIPHGIAVIISVFMLVLILVGLVTVAIIPFIQQIQILSDRFPQYLDGIVKIPGMEPYAQKFNEGLFAQLSQAGGNIIGATIGAFSGALSAILMLVFTIYILLDFDNLRKMFVGFFPKDHQGGALKTLITIENKLGGWLRGQIALMIIIGIATYTGLVILGVNFALALAVIAGLLEVVPILGPIVSVIPAAIVGFAISPVVGFAVIGLYLIIQQLENHLIVPKVMQKAIGFNPLVTIIALMVGGKLFGLVGAILAIPFTIIITEIIKYILNWEKRNN